MSGFVVGGCNWVGSGRVGGMVGCLRSRGLSGVMMLVGGRRVRMEMMADGVEGGNVSGRSLAGVYQLDEIEDTCTTTTLVELLEGGEVAVGKTDGPIPKSTTGAWSLRGSQGLFLTLERTFDTDDDRFEFKVTRTYEGDISLRESFIEVDGKIVDQYPVGFFKLFSADWADDGAVEPVDE